MRYVLFILSILFISPLFAENIKWGNDINKAFTEASQNNKQILVYLTMDNCIYCQKMQSSTLIDPNVVEAAKKLIPVKLKYGLQTDQIKIFNVRGFPTTLILQPKTVDNRRTLGIMYKRAGFISATELLDAIRTQGQIE